MGEAFQIVYEHVLSNDIRLIATCKNKDLLALVTEDDSIIVKRISHKPKTIASIDDSIKILAISFKEDGNAISVSGENGEIKVYFLESKGLTLISEFALQNMPITNLNWLDFARQFLPKTYIAEKYIPNITTKPKPHLSNLSLLYSLDSEFINFIANGQYPFCSFQGHSLADEQFKLQRIEFNTDLSKFTGLFYGETGMYIGVYNSLILDRKAENIHDLCNIYAKCEESFKHLEKSLKESQKEFQVVSNSFFKRYLAGIEESFNSNF